MRDSAFSLWEHTSFWKRPSAQGASPDIHTGVGVSLCIPQQEDHYREVAPGNNHGYHRGMNSPPVPVDSPNQRGEGTKKGEGTEVSPPCDMYKNPFETPYTSCPSMGTEKQK